MTRIRCGRDKIECGKCINNKHGFCELSDIAVDECDCYEEERPDGELTARQLAELHKKELGKLKTWNKIWLPSVSAAEAASKTVDPVPHRVES